MPWTSARPSIEQKLKALGFHDDDLKIIWKDDPSDRRKLLEHVNELIKKKKDKEAAIKKALNETFHGLNL